MNAESDNLSAALAEQLSSFDNKLESKSDDVQMLAEIRDGIGRLLASNGSSEAEIRRVLQDRYENGGLRKETFQLVKSMLDHYSTDSESKAGSPPKQPITAIEIEKDIFTATDTQLKGLSSSEDPFGSTTVIPVSEAVKAATAEDLVQVGSVLRDRFMLQERVSGGSMGVVYKALDRRLAEASAAEPWVAIKVLSPQLAANVQALRALQQEAAKGRCLTHPNIVRFIDLDRDEDLYFIIMEWLDGRSLADILDDPNSGRIEPQRALEIVRDVGKALDYAHRCGIVHADVKPGNIMIMPNGEAKLFDFGIARVRQTQKDGGASFDPGALGRVTPAYSSMQVLTGDEPVPADDVFSLACLLYRLVAGYRVFGPRNAAEAAEEGMKPQRLAGISDANWRALKKALSFSRVTRFETMTEFLDALSDDPQETTNLDIVEHIEMEEPEGSGRWIIALITLVGLFVVAAYQFGYLDELTSRFVSKDNAAAISELLTAKSESDEIEVIEDEVLVQEIADFTPVADDVIEDATTDSKSALVEAIEAELPSEISTVVDEPAVTEPLVDFSQLPLPSVEIRLPERGGAAQNVTVTLREDGAPVIVDAIRSDTSVPLTLRFEEVGFSGNRSPWISGQYAFTNGGFFEFPVGQDRARVSLSMASDPLREADQQSTIRVREVDRSTTEFATITVVLEDDDQRRFEAELPANTVAFSMSQASVRERDPAVQIDIQRFNPDDTPLVVAYTLRDITATEGEDYFAPSSQTISFGPGQRSARLLIPLVKDAALEGDEAFVVELSVDSSSMSSDVYHRIAVMIRDDE